MDPLRGPLVLYWLFNRYYTGAAGPKISGIIDIISVSSYLDYRHSRYVAVVRQQRQKQWQEIYPCLKTQRNTDFGMQLLSTAAVARNLLQKEA